MSKQNLLHLLESYQEDLLLTKSALEKHKKSRLWAKEPTNSVKQMAIRWFDELSPLLGHIGIDSKIVEDYDRRFESILTMVARKGPNKASVLGIFNEISSGFSEDLVVCAQKYSQPVRSGSSITYVDAILRNTTNDEREYLLEALDCARVGARRATVILGWCAAIDRMQRKVEDLGFSEFNLKAKEMKDKTTGRYKRFNKSFEISSIHEFRVSVFDTDLLWVLEYWGLIDPNQHNRLSACYVMRSSAAHPGDAVISEENLVSFFSDLRTIVFENPIFQL